MIVQKKVTAVSKILSRKVRPLKNSLSILPLNIKKLLIWGKCLFFQIYKRLCDAPGKPVIWNCGRPTKKPRNL